MPSTIEAIAFVGAVLLVAVCTWTMRSFVESDPDPFFLNLSFFALGGQCIRTIEYFVDGNINGRFAFALLFTLLFGVLLGVFQVKVMRAHMRVTMEYYRAVLTQHKADGCSDDEVRKWAAALLQITGTDFSPGSYQWLAAIFDTDPRKKSKEEAISMLPSIHFQVTGANGLTADSLTVPSARRKPLWNSYVGLCVASWTIFILTVMLSQKSPVTTPEPAKPDASKTAVVIAIGSGRVEALQHIANVCATTHFTVDWSGNAR